MTLNEKISHTLSEMHILFKSEANAHGLTGTF